MSISFVLGLTALANAHDLKHPELDGWFNGLTSALVGLCCNRTEAKELDDSDWETKDVRYRVRLDGKWYDVPDRAVVEAPNRIGRALVWVNFNYGRSIMTIRCFLPGTMT
jgi:hypothetical protein